MLKRNITYTDFNGNEVTEAFYFNLSKSEMTEMELTTERGLSTVLQNIIDSKDIGRLVIEFKRLILAAYGEKSEDGKRFIKTEQLRVEFAQTAAYDSLFMELAQSDAAAALFVTGVLPKDMSELTITPAVPTPTIQTPTVTGNVLSAIDVPSVDTAPRFTPQLPPPPSQMA